MAVFPKIQSPCPYKSQLASVMDGEMCRMCDRQVFDLSAMTDEGRMAFMKGCSEEVCVSYRLPLRRGLAVAAIAMAAVAAPMAAAAQEVEDMDMIVVGGIKDLSKVQYIQDAADNAIPELRVVYEAPATPTTEPASSNSAATATAPADAVPTNSAKRDTAAPAPVTKPAAS